MKFSGLQTARRHDHCYGVEAKRAQLRFRQATAHVRIASLLNVHSFPYLLAFLSVEAEEASLLWEFAGAPRVAKPGTPGMKLAGIFGIVLGLAVMSGNSGRSQHTQTGRNQYQRVRAREAARRHRSLGSVRRKQKCAQDQERGGGMRWHFPTCDLQACL